MRSRSFPAAASSRTSQSGCCSTAGGTAVLKRRVSAHACSCVMCLVVQATREQVSSVYRLLFCVVVLTHSPVLTIPCSHIVDMMMTYGGEADAGVGLERHPSGARLRRDGAAVATPPRQWRRPRVHALLLPQRTAGALPKSLRLTNASWVQRCDWGHVDCSECAQCRPRLLMVSRMRVQPAAPRSAYHCCQGGLVGVEKPGMYGSKMMSHYLWCRCGCTA